ncbi:EVE domain-containing protein [Mucilaginibacter sp. X5P1]|uniref:EVE domain-containing protein n=1 Tax=Mucilaginibacter sp. X5P1 TaxID=2723088 RepID=UPI00161EBA99|nr:EVE domain-containing protein [Mucilaginibacter sp. X5P1]MBB6137109.1 putative RNA-binding protein [Mucilaginibacter sp. X5P1]
MERSTRYWVVVVSKDHIANGVKGGFMQANHGKSSSLKKLHTGDWVVVYSPKQTYSCDKALQAFTAIGQVKDDELYQFKMSEDFIPYRRNVTYYNCNETPIAPLINQLDFIENKNSWGYRFRFGFFELDEKDFELISSHMLKEKLITA